MMNSPLPITHDLFSQLLADEQKATLDSAYKHYEILQEESFESIDDDLMRHSSESDYESCEQEDFELGEYGMKKRKRKSTVQLKILKN